MLPTLHRMTNVNVVKHSSAVATPQFRTFFGGNSGGGGFGGVDGYSNGYKMPTPLNIGFCVVPQQTAYVVERLGKYSQVCFKK